MGRRLFFLLVCAVALACSGKGRGGGDAQSVGDAARCVYGGSLYAPGEIFGTDCQSCSCLASGEVSCITRLCLPDAGSEPNQRDASLPEACQAADQTCRYGDKVLAAGESGVDGCVRYACGAKGLTCNTEACGEADAGASAECSLPTEVTFGLFGGFYVDDSNNVLDIYGNLTVYKSVCSSRLPACGTPCVITVATIAEDLANPEVQAAFSAGPRALYGVSRQFQDVADFRISLGDGRSILVGAPCCQFPYRPCQPIPRGIQRLANDLRALLEIYDGCVLP